MNSQQELLEAINTISQNRDRSFDTPATVLRVEGDTVWVHIDGGADETPVNKTISCAEGETVQVRISNGSAFLVGNASAPPTDDKTANVAHFVAEQADVKATSAEEKAVEAIRSVEAIEQTVEGKVDSGDSNIIDISSTMYQDAYGVNIFNDTLAVGDSYAHIDGDSFDIKQATAAGQIDNTNDTLIASFGREVTIGTRNSSGSVGQYSKVLGEDCVASGYYSYAEGYQTTARGYSSHAEGNGTTTSDSFSHAEGESTTAGGYGSHAEGRHTSASGNSSHAEGNYSAAQGEYSHAENASFAVGNYSHAEGMSTHANGNNSHSEGNVSYADGNNSHAEGMDCHANGACSHAQNYKTIADSDYQTVIGYLNVSDPNDRYLLIIGNGRVEQGISIQSDALRVDWNGNVLIDGEVQKLNGSRKYVAEPSSEGTSGQVLTTDGNGGRSWTSVSGGGSVNDAYKNVKVGSAIITASGEDTLELVAGTNVSLSPNASAKTVTISADNTPTILTSSTISASTTSYTFTDDAITADSVIDIYDTIFGFSPSNIQTSAGSCTVTFPAQSSSHTIKLFVY